MTEKPYRTYSFKDTPGQVNDVSFYTTDSELQRRVTEKALALGATIDPHGDEIVFDGDRVQERADELLKFIEEITHGIQQ